MHHLEVSGAVRPLKWPLGVKWLMYELKKKLESYLRVNLLGPGPRLIKKKYLPGRRLTKFEKYCPTT